MTNNSLSAPLVEPIDAAQDFTISIRVLRWLVDAVVASGVTRGAFLAAAQTNPALLDNDQARIARSEMFRLCEIALDMTNDEAFGLHWGELSVEGAFTMLSQLVANSPNLGVGLQTLFTYQRLLSDEIGYRLVQHGDRTTLRFESYGEPSFRLTKLVVEMETLGFCRLMRWFGAKVLPMQVSFAYAAPSYRAEYTRIFQGVERFEQPYSGITFPSTLLRAVPPQRDQAVHTALQAAAARRVFQITKRTPYALRVRDVLVQLGPNARSDMNRVAHTLGVSTRSLRRYLEAEGASYTSVASEAAAISAKQLLEDKNRSIQEAAFEMGFADTSSFHRAFKRWTGVTPRSYLKG